MGFISDNLSKKPYDYVCCLVALVGGGLVIGSAILGPWAMIIGLPIMILALIIDLSLHFWEGEW